MFIFILQIRHMLDAQAELYLFAVFSGLVWALWLIKVGLSRRYRPYLEDHHESTSVVVPVVDEPLDLFRDVLHRVTEQQPDEVIVVINGKPNPGLVEVCEEFAPLVRWVHTPIPGKRNAVKIGTELSRYDITVLVDSDTVWTPGTCASWSNPSPTRRSAASPPGSGSWSPPGPGSPAGRTGWRTPVRCTRCRPSRCSARSAACPGGPSPSAARS